MIVELTHACLWRCPDRTILLNGCEKFATFRKRLEKQAKVRWPEPDDETAEEKTNRLGEQYKYKGDVFELFVEALIRLFPCDKRLGLIEDYQVVRGQDVGVDGHGVCGYNHKPFTVQVKYRQYDHVLTANTDHLTNFTSASMMHFGVDQKPDPTTQKLNMLIVTCGDSLNFFTDHEMFGEKVNAICLKGIEQLVDNNPTFWKSFNQSWEESYKKAKE